jgi:acetolactate synthase-1/2/3 large subunit
VLAYLDEMRRTYAMNYDQSPLIRPYYDRRDQPRHEKSGPSFPPASASTRCGPRSTHFRHPRLFTSGSMAPWVWPAAIVAFARRDKLVIDIVCLTPEGTHEHRGDGNGDHHDRGEGRFANNNGDGMVKQWQKLFFEGTVASKENPAHQGFHQETDADGLRRGAARSRGWMYNRDRAIPRLQGRGLPQKSCRSDAGVYPMVGPGQPYEAMITGDWIPSRKKVDVKPPGASEMF